MVSIVLGLGVCSLPGAAAAAPPCSAVMHGVRYSSVQEAVDAASPGATVRVKGTCEGDVTIRKDLRLVGRSRRGSGAATLDGSNSAEHPGHVLVIDAATVAIGGLTIVGGYATSVERGGGIGENGGGIDNEGGSLTLTDSTVSGNVAEASTRVENHGPKLGGGGIYNEDGSVTLDRSTVTSNIGAGEGGGIANKRGSLTLVASMVSENESVSGERGISGGSVAGGIYNDGGSVTAERSTISGNKTNRAGAEACPVGGGIDNERAGSVTLTKSTVSGNRAGCAGGGVANLSSPGGVVALHDTTVTGNAAVTPHEACCRVMNLGGGGIYNGQLLTLEGSSSVTDNASEAPGGGIYNAEGATISFSPNWRGTISANFPDDVFDG